MSALATIKGGFFEQYGATYAPIQNRSPMMRRVAQLMGAKGMMKTRELAETLDGAVSGSTASKTLGRIEANVEMGGKRTIETETLVSDATVAGDITEINGHLLAFSTKTTFGASPVVNKDGNPLGTR